MIDYNDKLQMIFDENERNNSYGLLNEVREEHINKNHSGSLFNDFLKDEGIYEEVNKMAIEIYKDFEECLLEKLEELFDPGSHCLTYMRVKAKIEQLRKELEDVSSA